MGSVRVRGTTCRRASRDIFGCALKIKSPGQPNAAFTLSKWHRGLPFCIFKWNIFERCDAAAANPILKSSPEEEGIMLLAQPDGTDAPA